MRANTCVCIYVRLCFPPQTGARTLYIVVFLVFFFFHLAKYLGDFSILVSEELPYYF